MQDPPRPYRALRHRDYRRLLLAQLISLTGSQMQAVAIHWHIYLLTGSPLALGVVGLTRVAPIIVFSLWGGIAADRWNRRWVMFSAQSTMAVLALALAALTATGSATVLTVYLLNALVAAVTAFDNPARQALIPRLVPPRELQGALALHLVVFHAATIGGPALAGLLIAGTSAGGGSASSPGGAATVAPLAWIYLLNALSFVAVLVALLTMSGESGQTSEPSQASRPLEAIREGLRFVMGTPIMVWTMGLDFVATFFAGAMSLLPIVADQILHVGPAGYGWLAAAPALGAVLGSLYTSLRPLPHAQGKVLLWAVAFYGGATLVYGLSRDYWLTFLALGASGGADLVSTVIRQTLRQTITPDSLRGRMTAVNMIFFMGGPQLGEMEAGLVASLFASRTLGVAVSIASGGLATLLTVGFVAGASSLVRRYRSP